MSLKDKGLENYFTKEVLFKFKDVKEAVLDFEKVITLHNNFQSIHYADNEFLNKRFKEIFGDWKE